MKFGNVSRDFSHTQPSHLKMHLNGGRERQGCQWGIVTHITRLSKGVGFFIPQGEALHHVLMRMQLASSGLMFEKGHQVSLSPVQTDCSLPGLKAKTATPIPLQKTLWRVLPGKRSAAKAPCGWWQCPEASSGHVQRTCA